MIDVHHIDEFFEMTDRKLKFEQAVCIEKIKYLIETPIKGWDLELETSIEECKKYTEAIKKRQINIEIQADLQQLDLFS